MADGTLSLNPTILGRPLFPSMDRIGQALFGPRDSAQQNFGNYSASPTMMAGTADVYPTITSSIFPIRGPLIRTRRNRPLSERPDFRNPAEQWDVRKPIKTATSGSAPQPMAPSFLSPEQQSFYDYSRLSPQSQNVVSSVRQPAPAFSSGLPSVTQQFPFEPYRQPMAPVNVGLDGMTERIGVRTAYGMVYPTKGQEAAAQRLAQMPAMGARLAEAGKEVVRPQMVSSALSGIEAGRGPASLEGLTQAEKIQAMRVRGQQLARRSRLESQKEFNLASNRLAQERKKKEEERALAEAERSKMRDIRKAERVRRRQERSGETTKEA